jgi:hypothetical protein
MLVVDWSFQRWRKPWSWLAQPWSLKKSTVMLQGFLASFFQSSLFSVFYYTFPFQVWVTVTVTVMAAGDF